MIVNLLSSPRNVSTALMYAFAQRKDTKVIDEPFYAYYLHQSGVDHPGKDAILASMPTQLDEVISGIKKTALHHPIVFVKNMAHHLIRMDYDFLLDYTHVMLIRDPKQLIASFSDVISNPTMQDIGCQQQFELYQFIAQHQACPVLDSNRLLADPPNQLRQLCDQLGIPFDENMLYWQPGAIPEDGVWASYWYQNVHASSGFTKQKTSQRALPDHCVSLYKEALPFYEALLANAIS